jgi:sugar-specific transcriptional regulator TrmB
VDILSLERVLKTLESFGLSRMDAEVYVYLAKKGPQKGLDIADALKIRKQQLNFILKNLQSKGVVTASPEHPALFSAVAFEKALDLLVEANMEQAKAIKETKEELLSSWRNMTRQDNT